MNEDSKKKNKGWKTQLTRQRGEYLVAAELGRREFMATTFTGNVPEFDILAADKHGRLLAIQVKAIKSGDWQLNAGKFINIAIKGGRQVLGAPKKPPHATLICVFLLLTDECGGGRFFVFKWTDLQRIVVKRYRAFIKKNGGRRRKNGGSFHVKVTLKELAEYESIGEKRDSWKLVESILGG